MTRDPVTAAWLQLLITIPLALGYGLIVEFFRARKAGVEPSNERAIWTGVLWGSLFGLFNLLILFIFQQHGTLTLWMLVPVLIGVACLALRVIKRLVQADVTKSKV
jgi:hypothetical protein